MVKQYSFSISPVWIFKVKEGILAWIFMQTLPSALAEKLSSSDGKIKQTKKNEKEIRLANI